MYLQRLKKDVYRRHKYNVEVLMGDMNKESATKSAEADRPPVSAVPQPPVSGLLAGLEKWLYDLLVVKAPYHLPTVSTDWIVRYGPWITLVLGLLLLPALYGLLAFAGLLGSVMSIYVYYTPALSVWFWIALLVLTAQAVVMFVSIPMLLKRQRNGWLLLFYADLFSFVYSIFNAIEYVSFGSFLWTFVATLIGLYFLFQIRRYYIK